MKNLLLINFADARYGLWEDSLVSVRGALPLHRLPLSPPAIAGIAVLDDRSAVIADLAACLGSPAMKDGGNGTFLIVDAGEKIAGFAVEGAVNRVEQPEDQIRAVPDAVRTEVIDTCVVIEDGVVPIINIRVLHKRLKQGNLDLPKAAGVFAVTSHLDPDPAFPVRAFSLGNERFCVRAAGTVFQAISGEVITRLPEKNDWLAGITVYKDAILPLVRLDDRLDIKARPGQSGMLIAGVDGGRHGLLVDEDLGIIEQQDLRISDLPALARQAWMPSAAVSSGTVYPLIEAGRIISERPGENEQDPQRSFSPASGFSSRFRTSEVDVVEFSLLGTNHAVPKEEVKEVHALLPISRIPHTPEIVIGVADLKGELLPVLDLAAVFGRRSAVNRKWRMLRIANGDFQCLVVSEAVKGDRRLSREDQKQLPLALPHQVLYGCYLDAGMVRLIMNVQSLAVHFENPSVRELVTSLSPEREVPAAKDISVEAGPSPVALPGSAAPERIAVPEPVPAVVGTSSAEPQPVVQAESTEDAGVLEEQTRLAEEDRRYQEAMKAKEDASRREEAEQRRREDEARLRAAEQARLQSETEAKQKALDEQRKAEEKIRIQAEAEAAARAEEEAREQERETARRTAAEEAQKRQKVEAERLAAEQTKVTELPKPEAPIVEKQRREQDQQLVERKRSNRLTIAAVLAAALILIIYFMNSQVQQPVEPAVKKDSPAVVQKLSPPQVTEKKEAPTADQKIIPEPAMPPPLYLTVPPEMAVPEQNIYTVVKGDTLWDIAKRFTGNPFNYPRVARDNSIATPDLIFPGQRIKLVREKH
jgi:chemotaxis signal transduction protein/nucleoid-associated protein YgaU